MFKVAEIEHVAMGWEIKIGDGVVADLSVFANEIKIVSPEDDKTRSIEEVLGIALKIPLPYLTNWQTCKECQGILKGLSEIDRQRGIGLRNGHVLTAKGDCPHASEE